MLRRAKYFVSKAFESVRESPGISVLTSGSICAAILVAGFYISALQNLEGLVLIWGRAATLSAYLEDGTSEQHQEELRASLASLDQVERAVIITPHQALERFRRRGPEAAALVEGVSEDLLPTSIEVFVGGGFADLDAIAALAKDVGARPTVTEVDYGQREFERLRALLDLLRLGGLAAGLLILLATAFIVSNTIRLTVYARRDEIEILQLVGATNGFVRAPFVIEGLVWGLFGGAAAAALSWVADQVVAPRISVAIADVVGGLEIQLFDLRLGVAMLLVGAALGAIGSGVAVGRFLGLGEE